MGYYSMFPGLFTNSVSAVPDMSNGTLITTTGSGSRKVPAGVTSINIEIWGGGASGFSSPIAANGFGGGAGAYCKRTAKTVSPGDIITYIIGSGGNSVTNNNGQDGTQTTSDSMTAGGGVGGTISAGTGGTASGGDVNTNGGNGSGFYGKGGDSPNGGTGGAGGGAPNPGNSPGGGGGAGASIGSGAGASGGVTFSW